MKGYPISRRVGAASTDDLTTTNTFDTSISANNTSGENSPMDSNASQHSTMQHYSGSSVSKLKDTINSLPRAPQISRKVRACSACKKQKIRCDFDGEGTGESAKCVRCRKMKLECVVNRSLQTILDEDVEWKQKMSEDMAQLQRAVDDILQVKKMRPLSTYNSPSFSALSSSCSPGVTNKESPVESSSVQYQQGSVIKVEEEATMRSPSLPRLPSVVLSTVVTGPSPERSGSAPRALIMPMTRENSPEAQPESENSTRNENTGEPPVGRTNSPNYDPHVMYNTLSTNPMGSLYEVTKLRSLRSNSTTNIHSHPHSHLGVGESGTIARFTGARSNLGRTMSLCIENNDDDLISRGAVSLEEANELFDLFRNTLNHYLFDVALVHDDLTSVRNSSSLLLAAILTVSSLHRPTTQKHILVRPGISASGSATSVNGTFQVCYQHFLTLVSSSMFDFPGGGGPHLQPQNSNKIQSPHTRALDNVRALCIAAFWLPDLSWKLSGHAVRIATELNVHQSFRKAVAPLPDDKNMSATERLRMKEERNFHYEKARLWYLLYVCDHHFSIAYGRPPVICYLQHEAIRDEGYERYLASELCKEGDWRVVSQLALFVVLERIYECFAGDISEGGLVSERVLFGDDSPAKDGEDDDDRDYGDSSEGSTGKRGARKRKVSEERQQHRKRNRRSKGKVDEFNDELDRWKTIWRVRHRVNASVGDYPAKAVDLHYHFAKLQLNSLALRGAGSPSKASANETSFSPRRTAMARLAIESAKHVLTTVLEVQEIRESLIGVPLYVHTVISFAAVFLMKVVSRWRRVPNLGDLVPVDEVWSLVESVIEALRNAASGKTQKGMIRSGKTKGGAGDMHIVWFIANGLEKMVKRCSAEVIREEEADTLTKASKKQQDNHSVNKKGKGAWEDVWQPPKGALHHPDRHEDDDCPPTGAHKVHDDETAVSHGNFEQGRKPRSDVSLDETHSSANHHHSHQDGGYSDHSNQGSQHQNFEYPHSSHGMFDHQHHEDPTMNAFNLPYYNFNSYDIFPEGNGLPTGVGSVNGYFSAGLTSFDIFGGGAGAGATDGADFGFGTGPGVGTVGGGTGEVYYNNSPQDHHNHNYLHAQQSGHGNGH